jgi:hypothetical protein
MNNILDPNLGLKMSGKIITGIIHICVQGNAPQVIDKPQ